MTKAILAQNWKGYFCISNALRYIAVPLCALLLLNGCGEQKIWDFKGWSEKNTQAASDEKPTENLENSTSHMQPSGPPLGSVKNLFGTSLRSDEERLARLERAVQSMRNEFDNVTPSIRRLMAIEGDIQNLITELRQLTDEPSLLTKPRPAPAAQVTTPQVLEPVQSATPTKKVTPQPTSRNKINRSAPPPISSDMANIYDIRIGEHPGKTRIVLDVNTKTQFSTDIDNNENILIVDLPNSTWSAAKAKSFKSSPFLQSYNVESEGNSNLLIIQLKRNARISYQDDLSASNGGRRIVLDIENM